MLGSVGDSYATDIVPSPTNVPVLAHKTTVTQVATQVLGDHIVETGKGQTFSVVMINPIAYDFLNLQDTRTTTLSPLPSFNSLPNVGVGPNAAAQTQAKAVLDARGGGAVASLRCRTLNECTASLANLEAADAHGQSFHDLVFDSFTAWSAYLNAAQSSIAIDAARYQSDALLLAKEQHLSITPGTDHLRIPDLTCLNEVAAVAQVLTSGAASTPALLPVGKKSSCIGAPQLKKLGAEAITDVNALYAMVLTWEDTLNTLQNDIDTHVSAFTAATNPNVTPNINDAATLRARLTRIDLSSQAITGSNGSALATLVKAIQPFSDFDRTHDWVSVDVYCNPYNIDAISHALVLTAPSRITPAFSALNQSVGTVDCPGGLVLSAGGGYSTIPVKTYQLVPTVTSSGGSSTSTYNVGYQSNQPGQLYGAALFHYYVFPVSGQSALFATGGIGSSSSFSGFYGASFSIGRRVMFNVLWEYGSYNTIGPGASLGMLAPSSSFAIPTTPVHTTKITYGISIGAAPFNSP
ncbi:MAG TPA: hypothetical protein VGG22_07915 [Candidatus Baltobacteraceae bacterium]